MAMLNAARTTTAKRTRGCRTASGAAILPPTRYNERQGIANHAMINDHRTLRVTR
jgi:hypothetical protein